MIRALKTGGSPSRSPSQGVTIRDGRDGLVTGGFGEPVTGRTATVLERIRL